MRLSDKHSGCVRGVRMARSVWSARNLLPLSNHPHPHDSASKLDALQTLARKGARRLEAMHSLHPSALAPRT